MLIEFCEILNKFKAILKYVWQFLTTKKHLEDFGMPKDLRKGTAEEVDS